MRLFVHSDGITKCIVIGCMLLLAGCVVNDENVVGIQAESSKTASKPSIKIGWAEANITPDQPVMLAGTFSARISKGVRDPVTVTAMAIESTDEKFPAQLIMVSCDLSVISDDVRQALNKHLHKLLPELSPETVILNATHTHTGPYHTVTERYSDDKEIVTRPYGVDIPAMPPLDYIDFAGHRIAEAIAQAWQNRTLSGVAYGLGHAVIGRNRLMTYKNGKSKMYGRTDIPEFRHVEGYEDHSVHILGTYDLNRKLRGIVVNIACPSQIFASRSHISADFWHEIRIELRKRFGHDLFLLPQVAPAGDQNAYPPVEKRAEQRMWMLNERNQRQEIAVRLADAVEKVLPAISKEVEYHPVVIHHAETLRLPRRMLSEEDVTTALKTAAPYKKRYEELLKKLQQEPESYKKPNWYVPISVAYRLGQRGEVVRKRFEEQQIKPYLSATVHAVRLGDVAFVTNPFELYLDYGMQIRGRSPALQNFLVQLAGPGSYVPTPRAIKRGGYGAVPASTRIGVEGGEALVEWSLNTLEQMWNFNEQDSITVPRVDACQFAINGDSGKWKKMSAITIGAKNPERFGGEIYTGWDSENFYLAVDVRDKRHYNNNCDYSRIWDGDSIQFAFASSAAKQSFNLGLALTSDGIRFHQWKGENTGLSKQSEYMVVRNDKNKSTYYEIKIPLECLKIANKANEKFDFSLVIYNDDDGYGHDYWIELTRGIAGGWNPKRFKSFILGDIKNNYD